MAKQKSKVPLKSMLSAIDRNDKMFYNKLTPEERKDFSPWLAMRYASACQGDYAAHYLIMTHEIVNKNFSDLSKHPELQWMLLSICGVGSNQFHPFIRPGGGKKKSKIQGLLREIYPIKKTDDLELLEQLNSKADLKQLARDYGYQESEIKDIFK